MKTLCKIVSTITFLLVGWGLSFHVAAAEILGGAGSAAEKLIMDWAKARPGNQGYTVKFSNSVASNDLPMLQIGKIDFAILDTPLSEADLSKMNMMQFPFALSGLAIVVNLDNAIASNLRLDSQILGKIFTGEITTWNNPAISALNPRIELPNKPIVVIHSGVFSADYPVINSYIGSVNENWRSGEVNGKKREWPENSVYTDSFYSRISTINSTPNSIGFLPMQYLPKSTLSAVHLSNKDGKFVRLSDVNIVASADSVSSNDVKSGNLSLVNKSGKASWPISNFTFIVVSKDKVKDAKITELLNIISYGLKFGSVTPVVYNYVQLPESISKSVLLQIENSGSESAAMPVAKVTHDQEVRRPATDTSSAAQDALRRSEERSRAARMLVEQKERDQAIKEAKAAKIAADQAIKAANAARVEAEQLAEKNRLIAKAEKNKLDMEKAEKQRVAEEKAMKERELQLRNQKDEDPIEAYRRSMSSK